MNQKIADFIEKRIESDIQNRQSWRTALTKFQLLSAPQKALATEGILRYTAACEAIDMPFFEHGPVNEIIMDARNDRQIWKESDKQFLRNLRTESDGDFRERIRL